MAGKKGRSGNPNSFPINVDATLGSFFQFLAGERKQGISTWAIHCILEYNLERAKQHFGEKYADQLEFFRRKYRKTIFEQMEEKRQKQEEIEARRKRKEQREELDLQIRKQNVDITRQRKISNLEEDIDFVSTQIKANEGEIEFKPSFHQKFTPEQLEEEKKRLEALKLQLSTLKKEDQQISEDLEKIVEQETEA